MNYTSINLFPSFGIATMDNQLIGFNLNYTHSSSENPGYPKQQLDGYGAGFFVRQYKPLGSGFSLFAEGNIMGTYTRQKNYNFTPGAEAKGYSVALAFYPGIAYSISRHIQLETGFQNLAYAQYGHNKISGGTGETKQNNFNIGTGLNSTLGGFVVGFKWLLN